MSQPLTSADLVGVDLVARDRDDATGQLIALLHAAGRVTDPDGFHADVRAREAQMATGMPGGVGLPHARSEHVTAPSLAVGKLHDPVDWGAPDGPARLVFLIAAPAGGDADHLQILAALARRLVHESFRQSLLDAPDAATVADIVTREVVPS
ncbi:PTS sugar transporter subunit IIA [Cellulomonas hominis]|jgi:PTS system fructose-specific IIA component|uniref:PTS fructose transporter subunit IIA n=1 Tax=Cellulomonas hominis TaxID=156981 RepID=A0A511FGP7_9CELL|nr:PTS sugar transporter subunit IIA [Cellulomonas hominis]MBB5473783.1 PTS system fructose-specific IIA component [Cellulomonas hominis]MBU5421704.1 PTS sugar transporter subunit IIA [Cellulomonas hominis]NKY08109.1 PTS sugar transporter subunit IIA [Cellulomonas hominis]NKY11153.1 PTS sugar transporter subunit IIA [Cellulomonas hominis]GEL48383.1 PTS fructose transporter subunit IIA [Cellulomonas hominis]